MKRHPATLAFWTSRLPHWEVEDGRYFVTVRLSGALPQIEANRIQQLAQRIRSFDPRRTPEAWLQLQRRIFLEMESWLDQSITVTHLGNPQVAKMVMEAIEHRQRRGDWHMMEYVVMPNHLHMFLEVCRGSLRSVMRDFKRWTGHQAARLVSLAKGRFWQRDWFDHWSRSDEEDEKIIAYIQNNPVKANLVPRFHDWKFSSWAIRTINHLLDDGDSDGRIART
jgi:REP element-mobilizing transposase RayT